MKFPRKVRLSTQAEFRFVFSGSLTSRDMYFRVLGRANGKQYCRLGMAVAKKNCRKATGRNRLKRVVRESFRHHHQAQAITRGIDYVILPTAQAASICNKTLEESLQGHWQKVQAKNARSTKTDNRTNQ
jgi:ribonuclease P protein component